VRRDRVPIDSARASHTGSEGIHKRDQAGSGRSSADILRLQSDVGRNILTSQKARQSIREVVAVVSD
jgi:hypothetical protein